MCQVSKLRATLKSHLILVALFVWGIFVAPGPLRAQEAACQDDDKVILVVEPAIHQLEAEIRQAMPSLLAEMREKVGAPYCLPMRLEVVRTLADPGPTASTWRLPHWAVGAARPTERRLVVALHRDGNRQDRRRTLIHELAHLAVWDLARGNEVPRWLNEGLAQYLADEGGKDHELALARAKTGGVALPLEGLVASFPADQAQAQMAYALSQGVVARMVQAHSLKEVSAIVKDLGEGRDAKEVILERTGKGPRQWEAALLDSISPGFAWSVLLKDASSLWWVGGLALLVGGIGVRRRRRVDLEKRPNGRLRTFYAGPPQPLPGGGQVQELVGYGVRVEVFSDDAPRLPVDPQR
jgi:hypothetical protein